MLGGGGGGLPGLYGGCIACARERGECVRREEAPTDRHQSAVCVTRDEVSPFGSPSARAEVCGGMCVVCRAGQKV